MTPEIREHTRHPRYDFRCGDLIERHASLISNGMGKGGLSAAGRPVQQQPRDRPNAKAMRYLRMAHGHDHLHHEFLDHRLHPAEVGEPGPLVPSAEPFRSRGGLRLGIASASAVGRDEAARFLRRDLDLQLLAPLGRLRGVLGAEHGLGDVVGGGWWRRLGSGVGDGGGGGGGGVGVVVAAAAGGGGAVVGGVRGGWGGDGDGGESAADGGDEGALLLAAELRVVDAEGVGDVFGGGAGTGQAAVEYESVELPLEGHQLRPSGAVSGVARALRHGRRGAVSGRRRGERRQRRRGRRRPGQRQTQSRS
jgi:hypothetical protein